MSSNETSRSKSEVAVVPETDPTSQEAIDIKPILSGAEMLRATTEGTTTTLSSETTTYHRTESTIGQGALPIKVELSDVTHPKDVDHNWFTMSAWYGDTALMTPIANAVNQVPFIPLHGVKEGEMVYADRTVPHSSGTHHRKNAYYRPEEQAREVTALIADGDLWGVKIVTVHGETRTHNIERILELERTEPRNLEVIDAARDVRSALHLMGEWSRSQQAKMEADATRSAEMRALGQQAREVEAARKLVDSAS